MKKHHRKKTSPDNKKKYTPLLKIQIKSTQCSFDAQFSGKQTGELARDKSKKMSGKSRELSIKLKLSPFYKTIHDICMIWKMLHSQSKHDDYRIVWAIDKAQSSKFQTPGQKASTQSRHTDLNKEPRWYVCCRCILATAQIVMLYYIIYYIILNHPGQKASTEQPHRPPQRTKMITNLSTAFWIQLNFYFSKYCASDSFAQLLINIWLCNRVICASALYVSYIVKFKLHKTQRCVVERGLLPHLSVLAAPYNI